MKNDSFLYYSFGPAGKSAQPIYSPRALPHPGRNLGLGRQNRARALARLGRGSARSSTAVGSHPTVTRRLRGVKTTLGPRRMETLGHLLRPSQSLRSRAQPTERERAATMAPSPAPSPARVLPNGWARRRRAAWPRRPLAEPGEPAPRLVLFSRAGEGPARLFFSHAGEGGSVPLFSSSPSLLSSGINPWWGWGQN